MLLFDMVTLDDVVLSVLVELVWLEDVTEELELVLDDVELELENSTEDKLLDSLKLLELLELLEEASTKDKLLDVDEL